MLTLFAISTQENWPDVLFTAIDANSAQGLGPVLNNNPYIFFYFMAFVIISTIFMFNMFLGVVIMKYTEAQKREVEGYS